MGEVGGSLSPTLRRRHQSTRLPTDEHVDFLPNRRGFAVWRDSADRVSVFGREATSMAKPENLGELVQRYGYAKKKKIKLYGKELELVSDPTNLQGDDVFVDAREEGTEQVRPVQVPRNVVEMAKSSRPRRK